jgi:hypothetical protein
VRLTGGQFYQVIVRHAVSQAVVQRCYFDVKEEADAFAAKRESEGFAAQTTIVDKGPST